VLNNKPIYYSKSDMRNRNQMMARVQRKEDSHFNKKVEQERNKIISNIAKLDVYESELNAYNYQKENFLLTNNKTSFLKSALIQEPLIFNELEPTSPVLDSFSVPNRVKTRFLRGKR